ncbi:hypothetical protein PENSPDRAFT_672463 [Peniophora sp. CONT]|nr:hypothetical protein PENSPDRAFT_672463 [Peniophora sp. CONT]
MNQLTALGDMVNVSADYTGSLELKFVQDDARMLVSWHNLKVLTFDNPKEPTQPPVESQGNLAGGLNVRSKALVKVMSAVQAISLLCEILTDRDLTSDLRQTRTMIYGKSDEEKYPDTMKCANARNLAERVGAQYPPTRLLNVVVHEKTCLRSTVTACAPLPALRHASPLVPSNERLSGLHSQAVTVPICADILAVGHWVLSSFAMVRLRTVPETRSTSAWVAFSCRSFRNLVKNFAGQPDLDTVNMLRERCNAGTAILKACGMSILAMTSGPPLPPNSRRVATQGKRAHTRAHNSSVESVKQPVLAMPPGYSSSLRVRFFMKQGSPPASFILRGSADTVTYLLSAFTLKWELAEVKLSDCVKILTYADGDQAWQPGTMQQLTIPARYGGVLITREGLDISTCSINPFSAWACPHIEEALHSHFNLSY